MFSATYLKHFSLPPDITIASCLNVDAQVSKLKCMKAHDCSALPSRLLASPEVAFDYAEKENNPCCGSLTALENVFPTDNVVLLADSWQLCADVDVAVDNVNFSEMDINNSCKEPICGIRNLSKQYLSSIDLANESCDAIRPSAVLAIDEMPKTTKTNNGVSLIIILHISKLILIVYSF